MFICNALFLVVALWDSSLRFPFSQHCCFILPDFFFKGITCMPLESCFFFVSSLLTLGFLCICAAFSGSCCVLPHGILVVCFINLHDVLHFGIFWFLVFVCSRLKVFGAGSFLIYSHLFIYIHCSPVTVS